ncbi:hypothetical protein BV898_18339 [Hypsibius exemplaris]|uniref:Uncharacterized protein n=1 Tax=Hypsibius exemplaris TaxID=2072580 RepID=A0A9X6RNE2_HYPEX|nr:hypothetical protein BV898_18339 [Hypsibius exemplaris]
MAISSISLILLSCSVVVSHSRSFPAVSPSTSCGRSSHPLHRRRSAGPRRSRNAGTSAPDSAPPWPVKADGEELLAPVQQLALPVQQTSNNGWGSQPAVQQSLAAPIQQQLIPQPIVQTARRSRPTIRMGISAGSRTSRHSSGTGTGGSGTCCDQLRLGIWRKIGSVATSVRFSSSRSFLLFSLKREFSKHSVNIAS